MDKQKKSKKYPDGRGKRPSDPNQLAKWIVEQTTENTKKRPNDSAEADFFASS